MEVGRCPECFLFSKHHGGHYGSYSFEVRWTCADAPLALGAAILDAPIPSGASVSADGTPHLPKELLEVASSEEIRAWEIRLLLVELRAVIEAAAERKLFDRKETKILTIPCALVRLLNGRYIVSCKSGKDRTGMSITGYQVCAPSTSLVAAFHA